MAAPRIRGTASAVYFSARREEIRLQPPGRPKDGAWWAAWRAEGSRYWSADRGTRMPQVVRHVHPLPVVLMAAE